MLFSVTNLDHLRGNAENLKKQCGVRLIAVLKYDAYGCGMERCAIALRGIADALAVSGAREAERLVLAGIPPRQLMILDPVHPSQLSRTLEGVALPVDCPEILPELDRIYMNSPLRVQLRADLGGSGVGLSPRDFGPVLKAVAQNPHFELCGLFSQVPALYRRQEADAQAARFSALCRMVRRISPGALCHLATSASADLPALRFDAVRLGTALYGLPSREGQTLEPLRPVLSLYAHLRRIFRPSRPLAFYDRSIGAQEISRAGIVDAGYGQIPALLHAGRLTVQIGGQSAPVLGVPCMGHFLVDLSRLPQVQEGEEVFLVGGGQPADAFATGCGIPACRCDGALFTTESVTRIYIDNRNCIVQPPAYHREETQK